VLLTRLVSGLRLLSSILNVVRQPRDLLEREFGETGTGGNPVALDHSAQMLQSRRGVPRIRAELLDQQQRDVELSHDAQPLRDFPHTAAKLRRAGAIKTQQRDQLAQSSRRHARAVHGLDIALVDVLRRPRESVEPLVKQAGPVPVRHLELVIVTGK
jgi:hypothetical protein